MSNAEQNGNSPAHPCQPRGAQGEFTGEMEWGMTKREKMALKLHAALLTATDHNGDWKGAGVGAAEQAIIEADALLAALEANNE